MKKYLLVLCTSLLLNITFCNAQYKDVFDFNDRVPSGSLIVSGNTLFGVSTSGSGSIYSIDTNGTNYTVLFDFNGKNGAMPIGPLTLSVTGDTLFGMTSNGGKDFNTAKHIIGKGCIFSIRTNGTGFHKLYDFNGSNGRNPIGSLILNGKVLYGMTLYGGKHNKGCIFSIQTDGTGFINLLDFDSANGSYPSGSLTASITGDTLFGATPTGGANNHGCLFLIQNDGTGFKDLFDFSIGNSNGGCPLGTLIIENRKLYGVTGGNGGFQGCIFSINNDGTNYNELLDFNGTNGSFPRGPLTLVSGTLYGITNQGGATYSSTYYGDGLVFSVQTNGGGFKDLFDFNKTSNNKVSSGNSVLYITNSFYGVEGKSNIRDKGDIFNFKL
jgi:uncharacterized repeat protein (TIGR03803 family)